MWDASLLVGVTEHSRSDDLIFLQAVKKADCTSLNSIHHQHFGAFYGGAYVLTFMVTDD